MDFYVIKSLCKQDLHVLRAEDLDELFYVDDYFYGIQLLFVFILICMHNLHVFLEKLQLIVSETIGY